MSDRERKYALIKLGTGDYLLPSNTGLTFYRITRSEEEGWDVFRWRYRLLRHDPIDVEDWSMWDCVSQLEETRRDAINEALRLGDGRG
ncbi:MAG: hypothetical protein J0H98_10650 [Solirubrobacterales bacterium]|nr:hypothetical protein [Solirubrobacterales bacterium]